MAATAENTITFPYKRSLGPVFSAFFTALAEERLIGIRNGDRTLCPPLEYDPRTGAELAHDFVDVGPAGTVESWCWVETPSSAHPLDRPFAFASIRLDGADTLLVHLVDAGTIDAMDIGMRVAPRWRPERRGHITDIEAFVAGEEPVSAGSSSLAEPVTMMDYVASVTYVTPVPDNVVRAADAMREGRLLGLRCPVCERTYQGGRAFCPIDSVALTQEHELDLPQRGVVTNYTIITPVQYPGQTETEPFARVHILLDGTDVIVSFQQLIEVNNDDVRTGMRVSAVWGSEAEGHGLVGWMLTGEDDVDDPDLVNRIY